jgi:endoglucanase
MKRIALFVLALTLAAGSAAALRAASPANRFVHASGKYLVDSEGHNLQLRGINLGNWMVPEGYMFGLDDGPVSPREIEAFFNELLGPADAAKFWKAYRDSYISEDDIRYISQTGANSIRIPMHYKFFTPGNDEGFVLLDRVVGWAAKYHLYVILDMHCAPGGQTGANIDDSWGYPWLYDSVWERIAEHYRDNPTVLGYDLLNEPIPHFKELQKYNSKLEPVYKKLTAAIRIVDKNHVIILGGAQWDSNFDVFGPPFDSNLVYTFHKYWTAPTEDVIQSNLDFRNKYNVPIWLGESGENTDVWVHDFVQVMEKDQIGWAFWPYKKMTATSSFVTWQKPAYWDEIVAFGKMKEGMGDTEKRIAARPSQEHIQAAFQSLLENIRLAHCTTNAGYMHALNLTAPSN